MAEKKTDDINGKTGAVVRRRLIGAAAMLVLAFVLWHLGESAPPEKVSIPSPTVGEWQAPGSEVLLDAEARIAESGAALENIRSGGDDDEGGFGDDDARATLAASGGEVVDIIVNDDDDNVGNDGGNINNADNVNDDSEVAESSQQKADNGIWFSAGVFGKPQNADSLAARINLAGWQTTIRISQTQDGARLHQVRVINLPDDDTAEVAKAAIRKITEKPQPQPSLFVVQVGAFTNPAKAEDAAAKLKEGGFTADISKTNRGGVSLHRVRAAGYQNRNDAEEARRNLKKLGYADAQVIDLR